MADRLIRVVFSLGLLVVLSGCSSKYKTEEFIGKTSSEIVEEYGPFDCVSMPMDDGEYRNSRGGYTIREARVGFLGTTEEKLFFIHFDEHGVAIACEEGYRPGG
ncbi:MAG: hypothetical protein IJP28_01780 [Erysipelotrichales bacterium]|nr:hypothetical protein [Erysipelotrichales bacterium]MBR3693749.1 hypothetical protein [Erysipelotrichales bacterium]